MIDIKSKLIFSEYSSVPKPFSEIDDNVTTPSLFITVKEVVEKYKISKSTVYELIANRKHNKFPVQNAGLKKKFIIPVKEFEIWLLTRQIEPSNLVPSGEELLKKFRR